MPDSTKFPTREDIKAIEEKLKDEPKNVQLWCKRGDLIQLLNLHHEEYSLEEAEASYRKALEVDPTQYEPYECLGHYYDCVQDQPRLAVKFFRTAIQLGAGSSAQQGLAEAIRQINEEG